MPIPLFLLEPAAPGPAWAPFAGARPLAELRAGIWKIRERWEAVLQTTTVAILGEHCAGFHEADEPPCRAREPIDGPAVVAAAWFAPSGAPLTLPAGARRLTHAGTTVAWLVPPGERWNGQHDDGPAAPIDGLLLRGAFDLLTALEHFLAPDCADLLRAPHDDIPEGSIVLGDSGQVICFGALVEPGVVFDVRHGAVVLEAGVEVRHGSRLEGPLYAAAGTRLLGGHLRTSVFGPRCSVKGEVSTSLFLGYANKSHDGFVGHSAIGHWVNLGALTTTSNLKNTYGDVSVVTGGARLSTGRQFLGSLIGDHVKTAIGTLLSTGSVLGTGAHLFGSGAPRRDTPPFAWGNEGNERLTEEGFLRIAERVMPRRGIDLTAERRASLSATYRRLAAG